MTSAGDPQHDPVDVRALAAWSRRGLDRPLAHEGELLVARASDSAVVLGALQRSTELDAVPAALSPDVIVIRRGSGGAEASVSPGTIWMQLALAHSGALTPCEPGRLLNRYVRPLLRALTKIGALARYFDRDWISVKRRPVAMIAFAHDATTGRALVEAIVGVTAPFALRERASYLGKPPATLAELGVVADSSRIATAIVDAYRAAYGEALAIVDHAAVSADAEELEPLEPPWASSREDAIGLVGAGRDHAGGMRIGGELMVSRDAVGRLESRLASLSAAEATKEKIERALADTLQAPGVALVGVRSLDALRDALLDAFAD